MLASVLENSFYVVKMEMKDKEFELLKELELAMKEERGMKNMNSSVALICKGRVQAYTKIYEKLFGVLQKNTSGILNPVALQYRIKRVAREVRELLKS